MTLSKYGDFSKFSNMFSPMNTKKFMAKYGQDTMITAEKAPSLTIIKHTYGEEQQISIIAAFLLDSAIFYGNPKATAAQFYDIAGLIDTEVPYFKITELMLFFHLLKSGRFRDRSGNDRGKMYGNFNGEVIMDCLYSFRQWRSEQIERIEAQKRAQERLSMFDNAVHDATPYLDRIRKIFEDRAAELKDKK